MERPVVMSDVVSLSVHGPVGVLDLRVPVGASSSDVAAEYSRQASLPSIPRLYTRLGEALPAQATLSEVGIVSGAVLVALDPAAVAVPTGQQRSPEAAMVTGRRLVPGALSSVWFCVAVAGAVIAGWFASRLDEGSSLRTATLVLLGFAAFVGVLPLGPLARQRVLAAPAFAGAAAFALAWDPEPARLPTILGVAALAAAVAAAVARALGPDSEQGLRVWMATGVLVFLVSTAAALLSLSVSVVWAVLLVAAMLASRFVPIIAIDVPDQYLLDLERLAVTAWSARERPTGRRGRIIVPRQAVAAVAAGGRMMVTAASTAVFVVASGAGYLLLRDTHYHLDQIGARCLVGAAGLALLLAARSYRHVGARSLLRAAGLVLLAELFRVLFMVLGPTATSAVVVVAVMVAALLVVVGVALGRGWRSAWWSRQAEVAEGLAGAVALGSLVVAVGIFRVLWN